MPTFEELTSDFRKLYTIQNSDDAFNLLADLEKEYKFLKSENEDFYDIIKNKEKTIEDLEEKVSDLQEDINDLESDTHDEPDDACVAPGELTEYETSLGTIYFFVDNLKIQQQCETFFETLK